MQPTKLLFSEILKQNTKKSVSLTERWANDKAPFIDLMKFNPNHDAKGRFCSGSGGGIASTSVSLSKENEEYLRQYTSGKYGACCKISQEIEETGDCKKYIQVVENDKQTLGGQVFTSERYDNLENDLEQTRQIMKAIDSQPVQNDELVRVETGKSNLQAGDTITWGIRSTSRDTDFADKVLNQEDKGTENKLYSSDDKYYGMTEYRIIGNKKALDISQYSEYDQQESLVKGNFKVLSVKNIEYTPPQSKTFEQAAKENPALKDRYTEFTSKKGNSMIKDNDTGRTFTKEKFNRMVYHKGNMITEEDFNYEIYSEQHSFKARTVIEIEQIL